MNTYIIIGMGIGLIAALIIIKTIFRREKTFDRSKLKTISPFPEDQGLILSVREYLAKNKKIEAIKFVREKTGAGLLESKDLVESVEMNIVKSTTPFMNSDFTAVNSTLNELNISSGDKILMEKIGVLLKNGNKIEAIKLLVSIKKVKLVDAKNLVDAMEEKFNNQN
ncbi:MAG TPA: ribosomal protein L7/L12 [Ignavibacteria bacterium]|nr:ribosomal protein L7/L12 [Ignavibacteria bacterium]